ncbi:LuxR C-terminal-related transcriptional regulator [Achromobacter sp.]|uniref:response regulator transcription factor n=1 Tax=Achromobacter sp. TaxID=134375 RepID=UPI0028B19968|nr:LuxR C-terminal-related transcriptional regulator [Achromobacter sp.]
MQSPHPELDAVLSSLTARERQIVEYVAAGRANKVIAIDLGISLRTVEAHRARIFVKLNARNAMQLACRLCKHGRSGASPVPGAHWQARGEAAPGHAGVGGVGGRVLHEPARAYVPCGTGLPDTDASCKPRSQ